jgi:peptidoglycan/LPS O-acetylase OafA/YrhL
MRYGEKLLARGAYRPDIDGLRSVAVVPVVLFHAGFQLFSGGYVGVDVFFVISGYLITGILADEIDRGRFSLTGFYERRARRILPALFVVLAACLAAGWVLLLPKDYLEMSRSVVATLVFLSNFWFAAATSDYFGPGAEMMPLLHTWSLAVEEQFYIFFPLLLWAILPRGRWLAIGSVLLLSAVSLAAVSYTLPKWPASSFYLPYGRIWELGIGALLALGLVPDLGRRWLRETVAAAGLVAILIAVFAYSEDTPFPGVTALLPCLGAAALIAAGGQGPSLATWLLSLRPMVAIGLISYSLYLWHWPVIVFTRHFYGGLELEPVQSVACVLAAFVLAWLSWAFVERPFRRRPPKGPSRRTIFVASGAGMALFAALALAVVRFSGLPERFSPDMQRLLAAAEDRNPDRETCFNLPPGSKFCRFGAPAAPGAPADFLLWGDSHADAVMPGVALAAETAGKTGEFAGRNACAPLLGVNRIDLGRTTTCSQFNDKVLAALQARDDLGTVLLVGRWALTGEGTRLEAEGGDPARLAEVGAEDVPVQDNFTVFEAALRRTVAVIRATGREVVIVGDVPEIGWDVPRLVMAEVRWGHPLPPRPDLAAVTRRDARIDRLFADLAAADPGVRYVPMVQALCDPDCEVAINDQPLYFDSHHLTAFGAREIMTPVLLQRDVFDTGL